MEFLIQGSRGEAVVILKKILNEIGHSLEINDHFCEETSQAVMDFQRSTSIAPDGCVDDVTWAFLLNVQEMKSKSREKEADQ